MSAITKVCFLSFICLFLSFKLIEADCNRNVTGLLNKLKCGYLEDGVHISEELNSTVDSVERNLGELKEIIQNVITPESQSDEKDVVICILDVPRDCRPPNRLDRRGRCREAF